MLSIQEWFFQSWEELGRVVVVGVLAYIALIILLRVSGKRTLTKMNAFDLVVTFALGSTLATILLSKDVTLVEGIVAYVVLISMQYIISFSSSRWPKFRHIVKSQPTLLVYRGQLLKETMRKQRISVDEINAAARGHGVSQMQDIEAMILETNGSFSVISNSGQLASSIDPQLIDYTPQ